ncbi:MAG: hypothetical protein CME06_07175 [Gemmatimonadetes bacterium]|nr:hypothetical protein [Gemmatimonadota bacterium]
MNARTRNTVIVSLLGIAILGVGTWGVRVYLPGRTTEAQQRLRLRQETLVEYRDMAASIEEVSARRDETEQRWKSRPHRVPPVSAAHDVYGAITHIAESKCHALPYSYAFVRREIEDDAEYVVLQLRGAGPFIDVYRFVWELEHAREIYGIDRVRLRWLDAGPTEAGSLGFELDLRAYTGGDGKKAQLISVRAEPKFPWLSYNPFSPLVRETLPPNTDDLVEVERSVLRALTPTFAFVEDQKGELVTLKEGEAVYLGYLTRINSAANSARFTLNKGGLIEAIDLELLLGANQ